MTQAQNCVTLRMLDPAGSCRADDKELLIARLGLTDAEALVALGVNKSTELGRPVYQTLSHDIFLR